MDYPSLSDYNAAMMDPASTFFDPELARGSCDTAGMLGLPAVLSGGFAYIYRISTGHTSYAVRCFQSADERRLTRYDAISRFIEERRREDPDSVWATCELQPSGLEVNGQRYPMVKMEWVEGETLAQFLESRHHDRAALAELRRALAALAMTLDRLGVSHGDIQNGNILSTREGLRLVDYDGMFLPGMEGTESGELGHPHFQHPGYTVAHFGPTLDRFPCLVYDLSLRALEASPDLYEQYSSGENVLLTRADLEDPGSSRALASIAALPGLAQRAQAFARVCRGPYAAVPTLAEFERLVAETPAAATVVAPSRAPAAPRTYRGAYQVFGADDYDDISDAVGEMAEVVGFVLDVKEGTTKYGKPYVLMNFGNWREDIFTARIWSEGLDAFPSPPGSEWQGEWVSVTGMIDEPYTSDRGGYTHVSITVHGPSQIKSISREEAMYRLGHSPRPAEGVGTTRRRGGDGRFASRAEPTWGTPRQSSAAGNSERTRNEEIIRKMEESLASARISAGASSAGKGTHGATPAGQQVHGPLTPSSPRVQPARRQESREKRIVEVIVVIVVVLIVVALMTRWFAG